MKRQRLLHVYPAMVVFGLAFAVRLLYNLTVAKGYMPTHDSLTYLTIALNLLYNHCYCMLPQTPMVGRAPLWPVLIAIFYSDANALSVRIFLSVLGAGTCTLIYFFARDIFGRRIGIFSGCLAAIYPFLFIYDGWLYTESLFTFLLLAFCYTLYRFQLSPQYRLMFLGGILIGALSLTRPNGLFIFAAFILWALVAGWAKLLPWRVLMKSVLITSLLLAIIVLPWTARNYVVFHKLVPVAVGDGTVLLGAYNNKVVGTAYQNGYYEGGWLPPKEAVPQIASRFPTDCYGACEIAQDDVYRQYALQWIGEHPQQTLSLLSQHFIGLWQITSKEADLPVNVYADRLSSRFVTDMMVIITPTVFLLAAFGLFVTRKYWRDLLFLYFVLAVTIGQSALFYGIPRFRVPIEPILILLSGGAIHWCATHIKVFRTRLENGAPPESV